MDDSVLNVMLLLRIPYYCYYDIISTSFFCCYYAVIATILLFLSLIFGTFPFYRPFLKIVKDKEPSPPFCDSFVLLLVDECLANRSGASYIVRKSAMVNPAVDHYFNYL
jgi:hypothetical protein